MQIYMPERESMPVLDFWFGFFGCHFSFRDEYSDMASSKVYQQRALLGVCTQCGTADVAGGKNRNCIKCYQINLERSKARRDRLSAEGRCLTCAGPLDSGIKHCRSCADKAKRQVKENAAKKAAAGICNRGSCQNPAKLGCLKCDECARKCYRKDVKSFSRVISSLRSRLNLGLKGKYWTGPATDWIGCTKPFLKAHLESQFKPGMSWDNWGRGRGKWNVDHIYPISKVDKNSPEQIRAVCHYTNLQPLWHEENFKKWSYLPENPNPIFAL